MLTKLTNAFINVFVNVTNVYYIYALIWLNCAEESRLETIV